MKWTRAEPTIRTRKRIKPTRCSRQFSMFDRAVDTKNHYSLLWYLLNPHVLFVVLDVLHAALLPPAPIIPPTGCFVEIFFFSFLFFPEKTPPL